MLGHVNAATDRGCEFRGIAVFGGTGMIRPTHTGLLGLGRVVAIAGALAVNLAGCSGGDSGVELNGKIFDVIGLSGVSKTGSEPKLAERAPLVPPPRTDALPAPGSGQADVNHMAWPKDPDRLKAEKAAVENKTISKYCSDPMLGRPEPERAKRDAECSDKQGGLLSSATAWFGTKKEGAAAQATDEGDPAVVTGSTNAQPTAAQKAATGAKSR